MYTTYDVNLFDPAEETTIRISEDGDGTGMVVCKADTQYFGHLDFTMSTNDAEAFAHGILKQVQFIKEGLK